MSGTRRSFVFLGIAALILVGSVVAVGQAQRLFTRKATLNTSFTEIHGLAIGAPVRLAGVEIGVVQRIRFDAQLARKDVHVSLSVDARYMDRIRVDSVARLSSKGLLGDTLIDITVGSSDAAPLAPGGTLRSEEGDDLGAVVGTVRSAVGTVERRVGGLLNDDLTRDLSRLAKSAAAVAEQVEHGPGLAHTLLYDPRQSQRLDALLDGAEQSVRGAQRLVADGERAAARLDRLLAAVEERPGTLHGLIYEDRAGATLDDLRRTASDLAVSARTARRLLVDVEAGHGTLGALLRDPSIYEDLKLILGNVKRNELLKAVVRYTIRTDGPR